MQITRRSLSQDAQTAVDSYLGSFMIVIYDEFLRCWCSIVERLWLEMNFYQCWNSIVERLWSDMNFYQCCWYSIIKNHDQRCAGLESFNIYPCWNYMIEGWQCWGSMLYDGFCCMSIFVLYVSGLYHFVAGVHPGCWRDLAPWTLFLLCEFLFQFESLVSISHFPTVHF